MGFVIFMFVYGAIILLSNAISSAINGSSNRYGHGITIGHIWIVGALLMNKIIELIGAVQ